MTTRAGAGSTAVSPAPSRDEALRRRRRALRRLASAVSVVTVRNGEVLHGATVGTVTLVSREPLILGLCLRSGSATAALIREEGRFAVNVLAGDQSALARYFSDRDRPAGAAQFAPVEWEPAPASGAPLLDGALAHFSCRVATHALVGDHEVLLAHVHEAQARDGQPLLSFAGDLHTVAPAADAVRPPTGLSLHTPIEQEERPS